MKKIAKIFSTIKNFVRTSINFVTHDMWHLGSEKLSRRDAFLVRQLKIIIIAIRSFIEDKIAVRASALTYYSLMAIVPVAALIFAIAKGFNFEYELRTFLFKNFEDQQDIVRWVLEFVDSTLRNTKNGIIAGVGIIILFWAFMKLMIHIEESMNHVWNVKNPRSWKNRITNYLAVMIIAPTFLIISISVSLTVNHHASSMVSSYDFFDGISPILKFLYSCIPFVATWFLFALLYKFMPNTRVKFSHAMLAGIIAGSIFQLVQNLYVYSQISITKFSAIYGTFAAVPLFLIWAQMSWLIVLLGAELAFAYQNIDIYESEKESERTSFNQRKIIALLIVRLIAKNFKVGNQPLEINDIAERLSMPTRIVRAITDNLIDADILSEVATDDEKEYAYQPAFDIHSLTVNAVFSRLESLGRSDFISNDNTEFKTVKDFLEKINCEFQRSPNNILVIDL